MKHSIPFEFDYIETPRNRTVPTRIDTILEQRMRAFIKARQIRRIFFNK